jgi:hypothetical protein
METVRNLTPGRAKAALTVAVAADLIQLPLTFGFFAAVGSAIGIPAGGGFEAVDVVVDVITAGITTWLLGFHWALLPTALLELVPGIDAAPTWTACVLFVVWRRRKDAAAAVPPGDLGQGGPDNSQRTIHP